MNKDQSAAGNKEKNRKNPVLSFSQGKATGIFLYIFLLLIYIATSVVVVIFARSKMTFTLISSPIPAASFTGVFSTLANFCLIILVVLFNKLGYITGLVVILTQSPIWAYTTLVRRNLQSLPGFFTSIFTIVAITIIYMNNRKIIRYQARLRDQAVTDALTKLPNRFACTERMDELIRHNTKFALVSIDLNNFKSINETMGHEVGNEILIEIGKRWQMLADSWKTGTRDFIARLGDDEFALLIQGCRNDEDILHTIRAYQAELESMITIDDCDFYMTACFGYAVYPIDANYSRALFSGADAAMHELKRLNGTNHILRYTSELLQAEQDLESERKIRTALETDSVIYHLQPQFDINHRLRGFEALARIKDTNGALIPPSEFIPVAERMGLIDRIDMCVFQKAAEFLGKRISGTDTDLTLSVNISVKHMMKNNFIDEVRKVLRSCGLRSDHVEFEITESVMLDSAENALQRIEEIKSLGVKIAIDDFGTGYSSLSYLSTFPATLLKIDKSFIDVMNTNESSRQYVAAIISIGHIMNMQVISEGVETEEQIETLRSIGCDLIQGFIWGRPMLPEIAAKLISA